MVSGFLFYVIYFDSSFCAEINLKYYNLQYILCWSVVLCICYLVYILSSA